MAIRTLAIRLFLLCLLDRCIERLFKTPVTLSPTDLKDSTCPWILPKGLNVFRISPSLPPNPSSALWSTNWFSQDAAMKQRHAWLSGGSGKRPLKHCIRPGNQQAELRSQPCSWRQLYCSLSFLILSLNSYSTPTVDQSQEKVLSE